MGIEEGGLTTWVMETEVEHWEADYCPGVGKTQEWVMGHRSHILDLLMERHLCGWYKVGWRYEEWG